MSEKATWQLLRPLMKGLDPVRVENVVQVGTPDVNYTRGWIELKYLPNWPKRGGVLKVEHFTTEQRVWLTRRCVAGGKAFLFMRVADDWMLFDGMTAARVVGHTTKEQLLQFVLCHWTEKPTSQDLQRWL